MKKIFDAISRRHFLSGLLASVGLASIGVSFERQRRRQPVELKRARVLNNPYHRDEKKSKSIASNLAPGFYLYNKKRKKSETPVIHFVDRDRRIRGVLQIDESKLVHVDPLHKADPTAHVNRSKASYSFEMAALAELTSDPPRPEVACQLLMMGINGNLAARMNLRRALLDARKPLLEEKSYTFAAQKLPVRLFDLLAGLSVRYGNRSYIEKLIALVETNPDLKQLLSRLSTWGNVTNRWHNRWTKDDFEWNHIKLPQRLRAESSKVG